MRTVVYKLGGSLLSLPDLAGRLRAVLESEEARPLLVVGGGPAADLVRRWDRIHRLGDDRAHRLALRSMALNEALVSELLPEARPVAGRFEAEQAWVAGQLPVLRTEEFLKNCGDDRLPHTWDVTSDSIAAWVAIKWPADGLVLLKSVPLPGGGREALRPPLVDHHFGRLLPRLPAVEWINLRQ